MDLGTLWNVFLTVVRVGLFAFLCWGGWLTYTGGSEPHEDQPAGAGFERVGFLVLFAMLWASFEGVVR